MRRRHPTSLVAAAALSVASALFIFAAPAEAYTDLIKKINTKKIGHVHTPHDGVHVIVNKVGPFNNPTETYRYYSLPFCRKHVADEVVKPVLHGGHRLKHKLGESITGNRKETSPYELTFNDNIHWRLLCEEELGTEELTKLKDAIHNNYFFEMFVDDLPMWGYIGEIFDEDVILGETESSRTFLYPHLHFKIGVNEGQIVTATVFTQSNRREDITDVSKPKKIKFSYSVEWYTEEDFNHASRMSRYQDNRFLPSSFEVHWLSIINSFVLVLLLTAFLTIVLLRVLKNDFSRYMEIDEETIDEEENGWKLIRGDVFRFPQYPEFFCAAIGTGVQLTITTLLLLTLALIGTVSTTKRGSILTSVIVLYCFTSIIGGYWSASLYRSMGGTRWVHNIIITAGLFPVPLFAIFAWVNSIALAHKSTAALPVLTFLVIVAMFTFISFPLTLIGGIVGRNRSSDFKAPTRTTKVAREIPTDVPWFRSTPFLMLIAGFLPFSAIYIELHYIFASIWGHQIYTLFGILFLAFILLIIVTSFITVSLLYFQLAREDHRWWWSSYVNGGTTGIFIYAYSFYYYFHRSEMQGLLQSSYYFGYMAVISYAFFLMLGASGFHFSLAFVKYIYSRIKFD